MKENEFSKENVQVIVNLEQRTDEAKQSFISKGSERLKMFICLIGLVGVALFFNSCTVGYVAAEPEYVVYERPVQPSNLHVWIEGDWRYNYQTHVYTQRRGHWEQPSHNHVYINGYWQNNPRGKSWKPGHWKRNGNNNGNNNRRRR